jgi:hypothetical protein
MRNHSFAPSRPALLAAGLVGVLALLVVFAPAARLQSTQQVNPAVVASGGGSSSNGSLRLDATIGQSAVGTSQQGAYALDAGFWPAADTSPSPLSLAQSSQSFPASGGDGSVNVSAPDGFAWSAQSNDPAFLSITSGSNYTGSATLTFSVAAHASPSRREGSLSLGGLSFSVFQGASFADIPESHPFYTVIGKLSARGITAGCGAGNYCPDASVTREQMAAFLVRAKGEFNPPNPASQRFTDVPPQNPYSNFIDRMAVLQITQGCSASPPLYCPGSSVTREQMAAFIIRALHAPGYVPPPPASQRFTDVPPSNPFYAYIEEMAVRGITLGCGGGNYCPGQAVTRAQMAAFLVRAFNL